MKLSQKRIVSLSLARNMALPTTSPPAGRQCGSLNAQAWRLLMAEALGQGAAGLCLCISPEFCSCDLPFRSSLTQQQPGLLFSMWRRHRWDGARAWGSAVRMTWVMGQASPLTSCASLRKFLGFSGSLFLYPESGHTNSAYDTWLFREPRSNLVKSLKQSLAPWKHNLSASSDSSYLGTAAEKTL